MKITYQLDAGRYFIGDPSILFPEEDIWYDILSASDSFVKTQKVTNEFGSICAYPTFNREHHIISQQFITGSRHIEVENGLLGMSSLVSTTIENEDQYMAIIKSKGFFIDHEKPFNVSFDISNDKITYHLGALVVSVEPQTEIYEET